MNNKVPYQRRQAERWAVAVVSGLATNDPKGSLSYAVVPVPTIGGWVQPRNAREPWGSRWFVPHGGLDAAVVDLGVFAGPSEQGAVENYVCECALFVAALAYDVKGLKVLLEPPSKRSAVQNEDRDGLSFIAAFHSGWLFPSGGFRRESLYAREVRGSHDPTGFEEQREHVPQIRSMQ
ncbi:hypothetical protein EI94DRAFT_1704393 [Lactarius quietus]|nr:hypothetical protein EI94DRAFT_1704393 [Lactarius quietus]